MIYLVSSLRKALHCNPYFLKKGTVVKRKENGLKGLDEVSKEIFPLQY